MDKYRIDSHKLIFHPERVSAWKAGEHIFPIYVEMSPSGMCNHRCSFCALDFMGYKNRFLDTGKTIDAIREMGKVGIKSIMFGGEGEPLLHKDIELLAHTAVVNNIDVAFTTNGSALGSELSESLVHYSKWIKISLNAGNESDYHKIHKADHWERVWKNIEDAIHVRNVLHGRGKKSATIGVQAVLLEENYRGICGLIQKAKETGVDYVVIKPYSQHPSSTNNVKPLNYNLTIPEIKYFKGLHETETFKVIIRERAIDREKRTYPTCHALPFWSYIDSGGDVWCCSAMMPDERYRLGNIYNHDVKLLWSFSKNKLPKVNTEHCRLNCRMDECNRYLEEVKHPGPHVNFI